MANPGLGILSQCNGPHWIRDEGLIGIYVGMIVAKAQL